MGWNLGGTWDPTNAHPRIREAQQEGKAGAAMSERKYRHRGYMDSDPPERQAKKVEQPPVPRHLREPRAPSFPGFTETIKCTRCGRTIEPPVPQDARCNCGCGLHACVQCAFFDPGSRFECMQPVPVRITPKDAPNSCTSFEPRVRVERQTGSTGGTDARSEFDKLFKI